MPGTHPHLEPTTAQMVDAGQFPRQVNWMVEIIVQYQRTDPQARCPAGDRRQRRQRRPAIHDVVPSVDDVEAGGLGGSGHPP